MLDNKELDRAMMEFWADISSKPKPEPPPTPRIEQFSRVVSPAEAQAMFSAPERINLLLTSPNSNGAPV